VLITDVPDPGGDKCANDGTNDGANGDIKPLIVSVDKVPDSQPAKSYTAEDEDILPSIRLRLGFRFSGQLRLLSKSRDRRQCAA
jgi:hypothetical protein